MPFRKLIATVAAVFFLFFVSGCKPNPGTGEEVGKEDLYRTGADNPDDSTQTQTQTNPAESHLQTQQKPPNQHP